MSLVTAQKEEKTMFVRKSTHENALAAAEARHERTRQHRASLAQENAALKAFTLKAFTLLANIETVSHKKGQAQWVKEREELCKEAQVLGILITEDGQEKSA